MVRFATFLAFAALALPGAALRAQDSDEDWLDDCRRDSWRDTRAKFCEIRETGLKATARRPHTPISSFHRAGCARMNSVIRRMQVGSWRTSTATPRERSSSSSPRNVRFSPITTRGMP